MGALPPGSCESVNGPVNPLAKQWAAQVVHGALKSYIPLLKRVSVFLKIFGTDHAFYLGNVVKSNMPYKEQHFGKERYVVKISDTGFSAPRLPQMWSRSEAAGPFKTLLTSQMNDPSQETPPQLLGTVTQKTPTISQLLYESPLKDKCWQIIHDKINSNKAFHQIQPGTEIYYNQDTRELVWGKELSAMLAKAPQGSAGEELPQTPAVQMNSELPMDLSDSAKQFIGRDYDQMDCYELVVGGLQELGVQYNGKGGLYEHLVSRASQQGLARNHYLNGEGLVSASGKDVFKKTYYRITDPIGTVDEIMADMKPRLEQGQILSFSMKNRGHTGVISQMEDQWTFINSGKMDNNLSGENGKKAVGEENLEAELLNWFKLVNQEKSALQITLGSFDMDRLSMFKPSKFRQKV